MATFAISFRVAQTGNYADRYTSIVDTITELNIEKYDWDETTSFILIKSNSTADSLASNIYTKSLMDAETDKLLVMEVGTNRYATRGKIEYPNLLAGIMP